MRENRPVLSACRAKPLSIYRAVSHIGLTSDILCSFDHDEPVKVTCEQEAGARRRAGEQIVARFGRVHVLERGW